MPFTTNYEPKMKTHLFLALLGIIGAASAESPLDQLRLHYDKDRAEAIGLVNRRYILALQLEHNRAMAKKDVETANTISSWMTEMRAEADAKPGAGARVPIPAQHVLDYFIGSTWVIGTTEFIFASDGLATKVYQGKPGPIKWTLLEDNTVATSGGFPEFFFFHSKYRAEICSGSKEAARSPLMRKK